jgi:hypothetical protein
MEQKFFALILPLSPPAIISDWDAPVIKGQKAWARKLNPSSAATAAVPHHPQNTFLLTGMAVSRKARTLATGSPSERAKNRRR